MLQLVNASGVLFIFFFTICSIFLENFAAKNLFPNHLIIMHTYIYMNINLWISPLLRWLASSALKWGLNKIQISNDNQWEWVYSSFTP